jgi:hypothetical protein
MFIIKITVRPLVELATARTGHHIGADETALKLFKRELLHVAYFESGQVFDRCGDRRERGRHGPSGYSTRRQQSATTPTFLRCPTRAVMSEAQPEPRPSRAEAIRRLLDSTLRAQ